MDENRRKMLVIGGSGLVGVLAMVLVLTMSGGGGSDSETTRALDEAPPAVVNVDVMVLTGPVTAGTTWEEIQEAGLVDSRSLPEDQLPPAAITDEAALVGLKALRDLTAGELVSAGMFGSKIVTPSASVASLLEEGEVAVTIQVSGTDSIGGLIVPGDLVNVMLRFVDIDELGRPLVLGPNGQALHRTATLFQRVRILAVDAALDPSLPPAAGGGARLVTIAVTPEDAQRIAHLSGFQKSLALVGPNYVPVELPAIDFTNISPGLGSSAAPQPADAGDDASQTSSPTEPADDDAAAAPAESPEPSPADGADSE